MLGKRKRDVIISSKPVQSTEYSSRTSNAEIARSQTIFRQHFEAIFEPLPEPESVETHEEEEGLDEDSETQSEVSEWSGLSETSIQPRVVEVIDHVTIGDGDGEEFHRARQKAFMSSRPPRERNITTGTKPAKSSEEDDLTEKLNLKNDLDLQRLLKESHLLERSRASTVPGRERQMALDMRLQALGAKESIYTQQKMPRSHRIGMNKKIECREALRRKEAKENGIVLEKGSSSSLKKKPTRTGKRMRGVDVPGVGKFSGGTLKLSRKDVASIQGPRPGLNTGRRKGKRLPF